MKVGDYIMFTEISIIQPKYSTYSRQGRVMKWIYRNAGIFIGVSLLALLVKIVAEALAAYALGVNNGL